MVSDSHQYSRIAVQLQGFVSLSFLKPCGQIKLLAKMFHVAEARIPNPNTAGSPETQNPKVQTLNAFEVQVFVHGFQPVQAFSKVATNPRNCQNEIAGGRER